MIRDRETEPAQSTVRQSFTAVADEQTAAIPLAEETLHVRKREVVSGRVRVNTVTRTHEELVQQELAREDVEVIRVPIDREVESAPGIRQEGDLTIIPILEEILVVETRLVLKEEVHIRRTRSTESVQTPVVLRKQEAVIDRLEADGTLISKEANS